MRRKRKGYLGGGLWLRCFCRFWQRLCFFFVFGICDGVRTVEVESVEEVVGKEAVGVEVEVVGTS